MSRDPRKTERFIVISIAILMIGAILMIVGPIVIQLFSGGGHPQ